MRSSRVLINKAQVALDALDDFQQSLVGDRELSDFFTDDEIMQLDSVGSLLGEYIDFFGSQSRR